MKALLLLALAVLSGCSLGPDPCLWIVTNNIGDLSASTTLTSLQLRAEGEAWGETVMGEVETIPFGESFSFLLGPGAPVVDLRASNEEGTTWSRFAENSCTDGTRHETILTADDLDVPCPWTITNDIGDSFVNYALLDVWVRIAGTADWGPTLIDAPIPFGESVELLADVGWTYDLSAMDQDGVYYLRLDDQTCNSGLELESTLTLSHEAPPCIWEATNDIDGDVGALGIIALEVIRSDTGESFVTEFQPPLVRGEMAAVPFVARALWTLRAYDELGQSYTYPDSALCLDGGELYALDVIWADRDQ